MSKDIRKLRIRIWDSTYDPKALLSFSNRMITYEVSWNEGYSWTGARFDKEKHAQVTFGDVWYWMWEHDIEVASVRLVSQRNGSQGWKGEYEFAFRKNGKVVEDRIGEREDGPDPAQLHDYIQETFRQRDDVSRPGLGEDVSRHGLDPVYEALLRYSTRI